MIKRNYPQRKRARAPLAWALTAAVVLATAAAPAQATFETPQDKSAAAVAAQAAKEDMRATFGKDSLANGGFVWKKGDRGEVTQVVVSLSDQLAYAYRGDELVAVTTISSGIDTKPTPTGIFPILDKRRFHRSIKYDNAPMPFMQRLDDYGIALHAGQLPGHPASHGCVRLPAQFASRLFAATTVGTLVFIGEPDASISTEPDSDVTTAFDEAFAEPETLASAPTSSDAFTGEGSSLER
jgi:lipoprotein-anchoring transpeptidase ErfK/SrfK